MLACRMALNHMPNGKVARSAHGAFMEIPCAGGDTLGIAESDSGYRGKPFHAGGGQR